MTTKDKVLKILLDNKDSVLSGEKIADQCSVSRAAVWKAVKALRESGYIIKAATNGGYVLVSGDYFSTEILKAEVEENFPFLKNARIESFEEIDSTNSYAKRLLAQAENQKDYHNSIIVAQSQTAGRGRLGRSFVSPAGTGIYASMIYCPQGGIQDPAKITAFSAVAVCRVLKKLYKVEPKIKWINDIYVNDKKVCGILTEGSANFETGMIESAIIGIGININNNALIETEELKNTAGSILGNEKNTVSRCKLAALVAGETLAIQNEAPEELIKEYKALSCTIGKRVLVHPVIGDSREDYYAEAVDIDNKAGLVVLLPDGTRKTLNSGEVSLHK